MKFLTAFVIIGLWINPSLLAMGTEQSIKEIQATEKAFNDMAANVGIKAAFLHFAADDAVLNRNEKIISGKAAIAAYFDAMKVTVTELSWAPDFVSVSDDGSLGYTYGPYNLKYTDASGTESTSQGLFHTVWRKQPDGSWRYVYD